MTNLHLLKLMYYFSFYIIQNMHDDINIFKTVNNDPITLPCPIKYWNIAFGSSTLLTTENTLSQEVLNWEPLI